MNAGPSETCPHCQHSWARHENKWQRPGDAPRCQDCGCLWTNPADIPPPPPPPSARDELVANIENTIWTELERQLAIERYGPYVVDRSIDLIDGEVNMTAVAEAVAALFVDSRDDCSWCHSCTAIDGWKQPIDELESGDQQ